MVVRLRPTHDADLDFVLSVEHDPDNSQFILQWSREQHREACDQPNSAHFIIERCDTNNAVGHIILLDIVENQRGICLRRIVVTEQGHGYGRAALRLVKALVFDELQAHRFWLRVLPCNLRAQHLYHTEGFVIEENVCESEIFKEDDRFASCIVMSIVRSRTDIALMLPDEYFQRCEIRGIVPCIIPGEDMPEKLNNVFSYETIRRSEVDRSNMPFKDDTCWYKDALIYQLHVRAFADSDDDGVGDFQGLTEKLDYLQDLGVTAIWLLPFYPSPLRDDGYDIADYTNVHPMYGNLDDFRLFLEQAHKRELRVITELVINHTSDQHAWFQRARRSPPGSAWRNFYVWSDTTERYQETRIIFKDFEFSNWSWDPVARSYYWHRFYSHQPDLNFENPDVQQEVFKAADFWLGMGVDGLRLDAIPYLYEREGTNCENLPETHTFLKQFRHYVDTHYHDRMLLAEANQWPEDAVAYFGNGDECHMAFHFPLMPRMFIAIRMEDRFPITETLYQTPTIPDVCQWALFLRNHDELTLEMVTAEERSFMYRMYAPNRRARINLGIRRRLAPLLQNDRKQIELLNGLLFALPGTPVIYYGDEIGMGDNIYLGDRDGVRTPMQWSHEQNAGFSRANPQRIFLPVTIDPEYHYEAVNVQAQQNNPNSLLQWMKQLIAIRKYYRALGRGNLTFLYPANRKVLVFLREYEDEYILVVANLSRFIQCVELDLASFQGRKPIELFGRTEFPPIGELPYFLTLGAHDFYWFLLEWESPFTILDKPLSVDEVPLLRVTDSWHQIFARGAARRTLEEVLPRYLKQRRWFGGKARTIFAITILESIPVPYENPVGYMNLIDVEYTEGDRELYILPLTFASGTKETGVWDNLPQVVLARLRMAASGEQGILYDALHDKEFATMLLQSIAHHRSFHGTAGEIMAFPIRSFQFMAEIRSPGTHLHDTTHDRAGDATLSESPFEPAVTTSDQSNTTIAYGDRFTLKLFRRIEPGINPDLEIGRFLTEKVSLARAPVVIGALEYAEKNLDPITLGVLREFVPNKGDAWEYTQDDLMGYIERVRDHLQHEDETRPPPLPHRHVLDLADREVPAVAQTLIGGYLDAARLLGQRTAELHVALVQDADDANFLPEPFTDFFQRPFYYAMLGLMDRDFQFLQRQLHQLPAAVREDARRVIALEQEVRSYFLPFRDRKITAMRIRCHGNYHLGKVIRTDDDFVISDFEGEPTRSLEERLSKGSPLRDVASMLRSFHYAASAALFLQDDRTKLRAWAHFWYMWVSAAFLRTYIDTVQQSPLLTQTREEFQLLLDAYLLEKAFYELGYEVQHRPDWVGIPIQGILQLLEMGQK